MRDLLVHLGAGLADRRGQTGCGCGRATSSSEQLGQHRGVAAPVGREHQPEHEQHHQQRVEGPPALDPLPVVRARHAHQGADQLLPELHEARPGPRRAAARLGRLGRALLQDPAPVRMQRVHVHILGRLGRHSDRPARLRLDALPEPGAGPLWTAGPCASQGAADAPGPATRHFDGKHGSERLFEMPSWCRPIADPLVAACGCGRRSRAGSPGAPDQVRLPIAQRV